MTGSGTEAREARLVSFILSPAGQAILTLMPQEEAES